MTTVQQIEAIVRLSEQSGRTVATADEARQMMKIGGSILAIAIVCASQDANHASHFWCLRGLCERTTISCIVADGAKAI
jgi:hypothetical protein